MPLQGIGQGFESPHLHQKEETGFRVQGLDLTRRAGTEEEVSEVDRKIESRKVFFRRQRER